MPLLLHLEVAGEEIWWLRDNDLENEFVFDNGGLLRALTLLLVSRGEGMDCGSGWVFSCDCPWLTTETPRYKFIRELLFRRTFAKCSLFSRVLFADTIDGLLPLIPDVLSVVFSWKSLVVFVGIPWFLAHWLLMVFTKFFQSSFGISRGAAPWFRSVSRPHLSLSKNLKVSAPGINLSVGFLNWSCVDNLLTSFETGSFWSFSVPSCTFEATDFVASFWSWWWFPGMW